MAVLGVIPARSGSKGLPGKNIRPLAGRPLIEWGCAAALAAGELDKVICTTDCETIADIVRKVGISVPFLRPSELAADDTMIVDVLRHALNEMVKRGESYDYICLVQPTSPFISAEDIDAAVRLAKHKDADTVISGYPCGQKHPSTMFTIETNGSVNWLLPTEKRMARRQDLTPIFIRSGLVYVFRAQMLINSRMMYGPKVFALEVPEERALSIDTDLDFRIAEFLINERAGEG